MKTTFLTFAALTSFAAAQLLPPPVPAKDLNSGWETFKKGMLRPDVLKTTPKAQAFAIRAAERVEDPWIKPLCQELAAEYGHMEDQRIIASVKMLSAIKDERDAHPDTVKGWQLLEPLTSATVYGLDPFGKIDRLNTLALLRKTTDSMIASGVTPSEITAMSKIAADRKVQVGMPEEMAVLAWGRPKKINRSSNGPDQWVYEVGNYLYMENGLLKSWQTSENTGSSE